jgi:hypothetical protein
VKLKVIPGGSLADNTFINGVVFRKNVSHKKMANEKFNPRLLLLGGVSIIVIDRNYVGTHVLTFLFIRLFI